MKDKLVHAVTAYDIAQERKAARNPRAYHNHYALGQYLLRVDDIMADIEAGATPADAVRAGFTPGPLRKACFKALGIPYEASESHGSFKGLPVYRPASTKTQWDATEPGDAYDLENREGRDE